MTRRGRTHLRSTATIAGTIVVVLLEMALLTGVWHLGDDLDPQRSAADALHGTVMSLTADNAPSMTEAVRTAVGDLSGAGIDTDPGSPGAVVDRSARAFLTEPTDPAALSALRDAEASLRADITRATAARGWLAFAIHATLLIGVSICWFAWFRRLVDRHRSLERRLTAQRLVDERDRRLLALVQRSADLIVVVEDDGMVSFVSPSARTVLGHDALRFTGVHCARLLADETPTVLGLLAASGAGDQHVRLRLPHADGRTIVVEGTLANLLQEPSVRAWVLTLRDVTSQHDLAEQLAHQAFHDSLTGLANRALFTDRLEHTLTRREGKTAVMFLDLDDFKDVNDTHGHSVGDRVLVMATNRIAGSIRPGDTAARLGGDEFAVLMENTDRAGAQAVADRILDVLAIPVQIEDTTWTIRASVGIAITEVGHMTGEQLLRDADVAMYWAKEQGKGTVSVFDADRHAVDLDRMSLLADLVRGLDRDELVVHYQPTVDLRTRQVTGFEALVRWEHPERGGILPSEFVPGAERTGLVVPLGAWVLRQACRDAARMQVGHRPLTMSVNVSAQQLVRPGFVAEVAAVLEETGLTPGLLVLEITESVLLDDVESAAGALQGLRDLGTRIAIDDFGTGYSSLQYLSRLPVDILKVDRSFVGGLTVDEHDASVTLAILDMSRSLRLITVAEGVETEEQAAWLEEHDCDKGQGFLWSRPIPLADALELLDADTTPGDGDERDGGPSVDAALSLA